MSDATLIALARAAGVQHIWEDADGVARTVSVESLRAVLTALGLPCGNAAQCAASRLALAQAAAPDFITADAGRATGLSGRARLTLEDGTTRDVDAAAPIAEPGYHRLELVDRIVTIAVAPPRAPQPRPGSWGPAVQLYALRGATPEPFGDFGALAEFATRAGRNGADLIALSPVHALFTSDPGRFSPYSPSSRDFLNPWYGMAEDAAATDGGDLIDWPAAVPEKLARLRQRFTAERRAPEFAAFRSERGDPLEGHVRFEALHAVLGGRGWQDWPAEYRAPASAAVTRFAAEHADAVTFHAWLQWRAGCDLGTAQAAAKGAGMAIGLIADVAVGLDPGGSHAWSRPQDLLTGLTIGAPPDPLGPAGQGWGITSFDPRALRAQGFAPLIATLRAMLAHAGGIRIDHALGLGRLWVLPDGAAPMEGAYLDMPAADMLRLVALEAHRAGAIAIGEDLGTVPPGFRAALTAKGLLGMRVLWFERTDDGFTPPERWGRAAAAMTSTHDTPTIAGWWRGRDLDWRGAIEPGFDLATAQAARAEERAALWALAGEGAPPADPALAVDILIDHVASASCDVAIVPVEDLAGLDEAPNLPGTTDEHPNWRRRLAKGAFDAPVVAARMARITRTRRP